MQESSVYSWKPCFSGEESQLRELGLFRPCDCSLCEGWERKDLVFETLSSGAAVVLSPGPPCPALSVPMSEVVVLTWASVVHAVASFSLTSALKLMHCTVLPCLSLLLSALLV